MIADSIEELLSFVFPTLEVQNFSDCAVLAPTNTYVDLLNDTMMERMPGEESTYLATDSSQHYDSLFLEDIAEAKRSIKSTRFKNVYSIIRLH